MGVGRDGRFPTGGGTPEKIERRGEKRLDEGRCAVVFEGGRNWSQTQYDNRVWRTTRTWHLVGDSGVAVAASHCRTTSRTRPDFVRENIKGLPLGPLPSLLALPRHDALPLVAPFALVSLCFVDLAVYTLVAASRTRNRLVSLARARAVASRFVSPQFPAPCYRARPPTGNFKPAGDSTLLPRPRDTATLG